MILRRGRCALDVTRAFVTHREITDSEKLTDSWKLACNHETVVLMVRAGGRRREGVWKIKGAKQREREGERERQREGERERGREREREKEREREEHREKSRELREDKQVTDTHTATHTEKQRET